MPNSPKLSVKLDLPYSVKRPKIDLPKHICFICGGSMELSKGWNHCYNGCCTITLGFIEIFKDNIYVLFVYKNNFFEILRANGTELLTTETDLKIDNTYKIINENVINNIVIKAKQLINFI